MTRRNGFTLIELMVVIVVIAILAGLTVGGYAQYRRRAREQMMISNLQGIAAALNDYNDGGDLKWPDRLTHMFPKFCPDLKVFLDPADYSQGTEGCKPDLAAIYQYEELDEGPGLDLYYNNTKPSSFTYPFCNVPISSGFLDYLTLNSDEVDVLKESIPGGGSISWKEGKIYQLRYGDRWWKQEMKKKSANGGYPDEWFPVVRSFWHMADPDDSDEKRVAVVSRNGKFWWSTPKWENDILAMYGMTQNLN